MNTELLKMFGIDHLSTIAEIAKKYPRYSELLPETLEEINNRLPNNINYSKEAFCECMYYNKILSVYFVYNSLSHQMYGDKVVLKVNYTDEEFEVLMSNRLLSNPPINTYGTVPAKSLEKTYSGSNDISFDTKDVKNVLG